MRLFCALGAMLVIAAGCQAPLLVVNKNYTVNMFGAGDNDLGGVAVDKDETISPNFEAELNGIKASASASASANITGGNLSPKASTNSVGAPTAKKEKKK